MRERITSKLAAEAKARAREKKPERDQGEHRQIGDFEYDRSKAKVLKKALHNLNVSLGTLFGAMKDLAMLRGSEITPDGKLGGSGFIMNFREMKAVLSDAISKLSDITDTIADELTNPKWGLDTKEISKIEKIQEEVEEKADEAEEIAETPKPEESLPSEVTEEPAMITTPKDDIGPGDVMKAKQLDSIDRYRELLEGPPSMDKTAVDLGKIIIANLLKGEN
jgi:hypothetical protein